MARERKVKKQRKLPRGFCWRHGQIYVRTDPITHDYKSTHTTDLKLAQMWLEKRKTASLQPASVAAHLVTIGQALDEHVAAKKLGKVTDNSVRYIEGKVKPIRRIIGEDRPLDEIDAGTFDRYSLSRAREQGKRGKPVSGYTIRRELGELIAALRRQKRAGRFAGDLDVLMPADLQASANKVDRALSEAECTAFLEALPNPRWRAYFATSVSLGLRKSETLKVRPEDVEVRLEPMLDGSGAPMFDAEGKAAMKRRLYVHVHGTKTKKARRIVPVLPGFDDVFEYALPQLPLEKMGNEFRTFALAAKKAGIAHCSPNDFRRSWMTILGSKGVTNEQGAKMLGHASITMAATVYNQSQATQLAPVVEGVLARAPSPIQIQLPSSERVGRGRKVRREDDDNDPDGSDSGQQDPIPSDPNVGQGGGATPAASLSALPKPSASGGDEKRDENGTAPRSDCESRRVTQDSNLRPLAPEAEHARAKFSGNTHIAADPHCYTRQQAATLDSRPLQRRDENGTIGSFLTADADQLLGAISTGILDPFRGPKADGRSPDLTPPVTAERPYADCLDDSDSPVAAAERLSPPGGMVGSERTGLRGAAPLLDSLPRSNSLGARSGAVVMTAGGAP